MKYASVCDGIGAVHCAWQPLGWECAWTSEIEPFPIAVVEARWGFKNVGDMTLITEAALHEVSPGPIDLLVGGTPCQSFSVAGLRKGLDDPRGNLALRFIQLASVLKPRWIVWENVPGVLSSGKGRDFGTFLGALEQVGYGWAYRTLDAQWFGVAQRRRRVFVVAYLGDWRRAAAVLFERESVFGNPPSRGEQGQGTSQATSGGPQGRGGKTGVDVSPTIDATVGWKFGNNQWVDRGMRVIQESPAGQNPEMSKSLMSGGGQRMDPDTDTDTDTFIVQKPVCFHPTQDPISATDGTTHALGCGSKQGCATAAVAFTAKDYGGDATVDVTPTMRDMVHNGSHANGGGQLAVATTMAVRRLTPCECERLQGFPDDYTWIMFRGKPAADGPRYRALGNSMAVPVMAWIGRRIEMVEKLATEQGNR